MDSFERNEMERDRRRLVIMGLVIAVLILVVIVGSIIVITTGGGDNSNDGTASTDGDDFSLNNQLYFEDLYRGKILIPKYDAPINEYDPAKFSSLNGMVTYDAADVVTGVDVSSFQKQIDWSLVKSSGIEFAMIRLGYRGYTEGGISPDDTFESNIRGALDNGIKVGVYFFSQAISEEEAIEEAEYVLEKIKDYDITYPVAFDWEYQANVSNARTTGIAGERVTSFARAFCDKVKESGYTPMIYTNKTDAYGTFDLGALKDIDMWYAEYQPKPSFYYHFDMWQYTAEGKISGFADDVSVDINICFKRY